MVDETARKRFKPSDSIQMITCQGPVNIAVIKYWGKRYERLILPLNSSLSVTLDKKELHSITTVAACENFSEDCLWLNGRQGSGSACRSMYGGFVEWEKGEKDDGSDSIAKQIATEDHWLGLRVLILVVNEHKKGTSSTEGMRRSVETSDLLKFRSELCVPKRMEVMKKAISERDFKTFAETTMKESNQLHAVCQDTYPPITPPYMNQTSHGIVQLVTQYNNFYHEPKVAYTFDAGPNAFLFLMENDIAEVLALIRHFFPPETDAGFVQGIEIYPQATISKSLLESITIEPTQGAVKYIISTKAGSGPSELGQEYSLLDENGLPKSCETVIPQSNFP
ncbi:diphosphomevalonate decarboxylase-like isoform X2 [Orbicella faveolata]|uniref:diphosphomevalonate decarboxylase-like isoform X2 n=1 Tax=Orbicella faveolata TaxID=48498 RepID=UPI0009E5A8C6|nr:diphosphomevalonate decarboxylase-like isoform X2 [Orbicella faveolata]